VNEYVIAELKSGQEGGFSPRGAARELWKTRDFETIVSGPAECIAGETIIDDPVSGIGTRIDKLCRLGKRPIVQTMDGPVLAEVPFLKGRDRIFRVRFNDGTDFCGTRQHFILTELGWRGVGSLQVGDRVPSSSRSQRGCGEVFCQPKFSRGGSHCLQTVEDCSDRCLNSYRQDDEQPLSGVIGVQVVSPSQSDVRVQARDCPHPDDPESRVKRIRFCRFGVRPSSERFQNQNWNVGRIEYSEKSKTPSHAACLYQLPSPSRTVKCRFWQGSSWENSDLVQWKLVDSIEFDRIDDFYDLRVPDSEHYSAHGVWHHNTGKTWGCLQYADALLWKYPNAQGVMCRKVYSTLVGTAIQTLKRILGPDTPVKTYGGEHPQWFDYPNGSRLWLAGMDNPGKALSSERDFVYINQAEELSLNDFEILLTRTTGRGAVMPYTRVFGDCNPGPPQHWLKQRSISGPLKMLDSHHRDNPTLFTESGEITQQGKRTMGILSSLTGARRLRLLEGKWSQAEGLVYEGFDAEKHVITRKKFSEVSVRRYVFGIDWGYTNPGIIQVWGIDGDGRAYLTKEIFRSKRTLDWWILRAKELNQEYRPELVVCDPAEPANIEAFYNAKLPVIAGFNDISPGIQCVAQRLKDAGDKKPRLFMVEDAREEIDEALVEMKFPTSTREEMDAYSWPKSADGKPIKEVPIDKDNHGCDAMRYVMAQLDGLNGRIVQFESDFDSYIATARG